MGLDRRDDDSAVNEEKEAFRVGKPFKDIGSENTASLKIKKTIAEISQSLENNLDPQRSDLTSDQITFQFMTAKIYENRNTIGKASVTASKALPLAGGTMTGNVNFGDNDITNVDSLDADKFSIAGGTEMTGILDEDTMSTNSATQLATQQSIKAYVDTRYSYQYIHFFSISDNDDNWAVPHANGWVAYNNKWNTDLADNTTTIGDTVTMGRSPAMSGFIVPHDDCVLVGFYAMVRNNDNDNQSHVGLFHNTYAEVGAKSGNTSTWALQAYAAADKTGYSDTPSTAGGNSYTGPCKAIDMGRSLALNAGDMIVPAVMEETANKIYFNITVVIKTPIF